MKGIADTGFIVAYLHRRDIHHAWATRVANSVSAPLLTCEAVLAEAVFHVQSAGTVLALVQLGLLQLAFDAGSHLESITKLAHRFEDRNPDFADLCLIRMSELYPRHTVITTDATDFRVYRRNGREAIPLLLPTHKR